MKIKTQTLDAFLADIPDEFAIIEHPDLSLEICCGTFKSSSELSVGQKNIFFTDYLLKNSQKFIQPGISFTVSASERKHIASSHSAESTIKLEWRQLDENSFLKSYEFFKLAIEDNQLTKAVPVSFRYSSSEIKNEYIYQWLIRLIKGQAGLYSYAFKYKDFLMLGASPEILFNLKKNIVRSEAVAGSILGPSAPIKKLTDKLIEEQQLVVDDLVCQLQNFGKVNVSELTLKNLSALCHLKSDILVELKSKVFADQLIESLHPSGALGLLPRKEISHNLINSLDHTGNRGPFGAPFGIIDCDGSAQIIVAIRNLIIEKNRLRIGAGVGITAKSEYISELQEIKAKQSAVMNFFGIADEQT